MYVWMGSLYVWNFETAMVNGGCVYACVVDDRGILDCVCLTAVDRE